MRAGKLRHRVAIRENQSTAIDAAGHPVPNWVTIATVWASVEQLSGRELYSAQQVQPLATHKVNLRYLPGVTSKMQVVWDGRSLHIYTVENIDGRNIELVLTCGES